MVSKITIIEPRFDGAEFGTNTFHGKSADDEADTNPQDRTEQRPPTGPIRARWILGMAVLSFALLLGVVGLRRL